MFAIASVGFLTLFVLIQMLTDIPDLLKHGGRFLLGGYLLQAPFMFVQISPIVTFMSSLLLISEMLKHNEVRILEIAGIPPLQVYQILMAGGALVGLLIFGVNNRLVPYCQKQLAPFGPARPVSFASPDIFLHADRFQPPDALEGVQIQRTLPDGRLIAVKADRARYAGGRWDISGGTSWTFGASGYLEREVTFVSLSMELPLTPELLAALSAPAERFTLAELKDLARRLRRLDIVPTPFLVGLQEKIAYPLLNLFIILAGLPFFLWRDKLNRFYIFGFSLVVAFVCYVLYTTGIAFARSGKTPIFFGVWMVHILIFLLAAIFIFRLQVQRKTSII